jgi:hypothetical protein
VGYDLEPLHSGPSGPFYAQPTLIVQARCERHDGVDLEQDVINGIAEKGLRGMVEGKHVGFRTLPHVDNRLFDLQLYDLH